jgi:hypothetical protein
MTRMHIYVCIADLSWRTCPGGRVLADMADLCWRTCPDVSGRTRTDVPEAMSQWTFPSGRVLADVSWRTCPADMSQRTCQVLSDLSILFHFRTNSL